MVVAVNNAGVLGYRSIDDILGEGAGRFFSAGFKRVAQRLADITIGDDEDGRPGLTASASLAYPDDWSTKSPDVALRPHLSSVDVTVYAVVLSELLLTHAYALDAEQRRRMWLRGVTIRSGSAPLEDLDAFAVAARALLSRPSPEVSTRRTTVVECLVGNLKVRCEVDHDAPGERGTPRRYADAAELLGSDATRYYGDGFKQRRHLIENIAFTADRGRVTADVSVLPGPQEELLTEGFGARYQPSLSAVDCMVTMAQVNQALLYLQDGVDRRDSNTLWLRKFALVATRPEQPFGKPFAVSAHAVSSELVEYAGGSWRTFTMAGEFQGFSGHTLLTHRLPTTHARGE